MWNMMCDVMPTISEDSISQRSSQFGDDANFEQLMVSMLDERDKLVDSLKNEQEKTGDLEQKQKDLEKERDSLRRQLEQNLPQVRKIFILLSLPISNSGFISIMVKHLPMYLKFVNHFYVKSIYNRLRHLHQNHLTSISAIAGTMLT